eukprot:TRINITY_DN1052_c0_g1_i1.p1 TRINITY_DN1052_c0_g1~~TRINITY_DN1052_c0_g1_i1.p1  ORF type:complete len:783 (-),score=150.58 TRINITY_DN1052_c0_g1_i1:76-2424(-)
MAEPLQQPKPRDVIYLSLTSNYATSWKTWEGIREHVQNWHDGLLQTIEVSSIASISTNLKFQRHEVPNGNVLITATCGEVLLGTLSYSAKQQKLTMTNHKIGLSRRVLLLGHSEKAANATAIGQFGEGMKIGSLALLREGRGVSMYTRNERWMFSLEDHPGFGEKVLSVLVFDRNVNEIQPYQDEEEAETSGLSAAALSTSEESKDDTVTVIRPIEVAEFGDMIHRFLFLGIRGDYVRTDTGTLLLDESYKGQLFVKGIYITSVNGIGTGLDILIMKLDRDRRAVLNISELERRLARMWERALVIRSDLMPRYFEMLSAPDISSDIRQAAQLMSDPLAIDFIASEFFRIHGVNAIPASNSCSLNFLNSFQEETKAKIVLCNNVLYELLSKSKTIKNFESFMSDTSKRKRSYLRLIGHGLSIVRHAVKIVELAGISVDLNNIDAIRVDANDMKSANDLVWMSGGRIEIAHLLLDQQFVHSYLQSGDTYSAQSDDLALLSTPSTNSSSSSSSSSSNCPNQHCMCCEAVIATLLIWLQEKKGVKLNISNLVAKMASQICDGFTRAFCASIHLKGSNELFDEVFESKEMSLRNTIQILKLEIEDIKEEHLREYNKLQREIKKLDEMVMSEEKNLIKVENEWSQKHQNVVKNLHEEINDNRRQILYLEQQVLDLQNKVQEEREKADRIERTGRQDLMAYHKRLAQRTEQLQEILQTQGEKGDTLEKLLAELKKENSSGLCLVCIDNKVDCMLLPCRHYYLCTICARVLDKCPVCRSRIDQRITSYGN